MVNIKVAVRIRPLSQRELIQGEEVVVRKEDKFVVVTNPKIPERQDGDSRQRTRRFSVDFCYDAAEGERSSQEAVYKEIGSEVLEAMFEGYNACVLAYGHSASGKTYTIMGPENDPGLTPRLCEGLFHRISDKLCDGSIRMEVAARYNLFRPVWGDLNFLEIYNEKVKDLLGSEETGVGSGIFPLRVREHPKLGPYVQGLSEHLVTDGRALLVLLATGNGRRSTAATENNAQSSRSHALFTIHFRQSDGAKCGTDKWSKLHLVDLAGSLPEVFQQESPPDERATSAQSRARLQEGANINKSLVTLGNVISALESLESNVVSSSAVQKDSVTSKSWHPFVPYRDSVLTWLLKDTLGGNSHTIMIASRVFGETQSVSPASGCLSETVNTLRYAKRTKRIVNQAIVNEDPKVRTIRELRKEIARLKGLLVSIHSVPSEGCGERETWQKWVAAEEGMRRSGRNGGGDGSSTDGSGPRECVLEHSAASLRGSAVNGNDEKESVVNGSANDTFSHESQVFSDSLESLGSVFVRSGKSFEEVRENLGGVGKTEAGAGEKPRKKELPGMLHRSRPDLIKGISGRFKERLPSTSSQSCTDISNLSQSTSENSLNSSGSLEVHSSENRPPRGAPGSDTSPEKEHSGTPKDRRSQIVDAVTTRLYTAHRNADHRPKTISEVDSSKLCKRARMKLFDISRKLALKRRTKRTVDIDTQTDSLTGTVRVKEKCVETDLARTSEEEALKESATQTAREEKSDKSANTSPVEFGTREEECFSDDSLDLEDDSKTRGRAIPGAITGGVAPSTAAALGSCGDERLMRFGGERRREIGPERLFDGLSVSPDAGAPQAGRKGFTYTTLHPSGGSLPSRKEENLSSDSSLTSAEGTECISSSEGSSEDFVFYENPKERDSGVGGTAAKERELYTITENSEYSDPSDAFSPIQSQSHWLGVREVDSGTQRWNGIPWLRSRRNGGNEKGSEGTGGPLSIRPPDSSGEAEDSENEGEGEREGKVSSSRAKSEDPCGGGGAKKLKWVEWQSSCENQYLNLNISGGTKAPFSIDTHLFGKEWRKEQSSETLFTSADSVTLVLMGPANPKSSVLMEIIKRSLDGNSSSSTASSPHKKSKNRGVQCDSGLVRSVSVDTAMIALSKIARNQHKPPLIPRTTSLGTLDPQQSHATPQGDTGSHCNMHFDDFNTHKKKSALKGSLGTHPVSHHHAESEVVNQKPPQLDRPKKSVSWSGETTSNVPLQSVPTEYPPYDPRTHYNDDLTTFLKEAIHLLRNIHSSSSRHEVLSDDAGQETEVGREKASEEGGKGSVKTGGWVTWPRRRSAAGKPPTGVRERSGRAGASGRNEWVHSSGAAEWARGHRSGPEGSGWRVTMGCSGLKWGSEGESGRESGRPWCSQECKGSKEVCMGGSLAGRAKMGKVRFESLEEAEAELENCCRRLELATELDETREKILKGRTEAFDYDECEAELRVDEEKTAEGVKRRKAGKCAGDCTCRPSARDPCKHLLTKGCHSSFELDSFGPGSNHCRQFCIFCRQKDVELYSSALDLNSGCNPGVCRLNYYGYCPCSPIRLPHISSSPRAYMRHLLTLRREIVGRTKSLPLDPHSFRRNNPSLPCFPPS